MRIAILARMLAATVTLAACGRDEVRVPPVFLSDGTYRVVSGGGYAPADEARLFAVMAQLDRANARLVFTMPDGSQKALAFASRSRERWQPDCYTMTSHSLDEVADLLPPPLQVESLTFATPLVFAVCDPRRMILANDSAGDAAPWLAFDLQWESEVTGPPLPRPRARLRER